MEFKALEKVGFDTLMSDFGKRIFLPQGIFYWSGRAKKEAKINATIGTAKAKQSDLYDDGDDSFVTCHLPSMKKFFPDMGSEQIFPYAPIAGYPAFRQAWKKYLLFKAGDQADAIENNLMTAEQVNECLDIQAKLRKLGGAEKKVAEIAVEKGYIDENQLREMLALQKRKITRLDLKRKAQGQD